MIILGWRPEGRPLSFVIENGAHAGPGYEETRGFALLPADAPLKRQGRRYLRGTDLRDAAQRLLGRSEAEEAPRRSSRPVKRRNTLRIMTYNVHSCVGMDGRLSTSRIARIISQCRPDIVALQELDVGRGRTGSIDLAMQCSAAGRCGWSRRALCPRLPAGWTWSRAERSGSA
jgi:hypothetical protein